MKTTSIGQAAETAVAEELKDQAYKILGRNWKTKVCEIDIIAQKDKVIYFVEVKYRGASAQGEGLEDIGPQKLRRMHFAASVWVQAHGYNGDYRLLAASVSSPENIYKVDQILEIN